MKTLIHKSTAIALALMILSPQLAQAGYNVYPPFVNNGYTFFEDSDNQANSEYCKKNPAAVCISATYLPKAIKLAKSEDHVPMLSQGIFLSYLSWWASKVVYNMTLEPDYGKPEEDLAAYKKMLAVKYELRVENVDISPVNVTSVQFILRNAFGTQLTAPGPRSSASSNPAATAFTQTLVPDWTGDYHALGSRFSVSIKGALWDLEPALQNMLLNKAGNGAVGQVSFGIPVKAIAYHGQMVCNVRRFQEVVKNTVKTWQIVHTEHDGSTADEFNNDEKNAIRASLRIEDYCDFKTFIDSYHVKESDLKARAASLFENLFTKSFTKLEDSKPEAPTEGKDAKYTAFDSSSTMDSSGNIKLNLEESFTFELKSDLDFYAGGVTADNLDPVHKYLCQHFEKFDAHLDRCQMACNPMTEVYIPGHTRADARGCISITSGAPLVPSGGQSL